MQISHAVGHWRQVKPYRGAGLFFSRGYVRFIFSLEAASLFEDKVLFPSNIKIP